MNADLIATATVDLEASLDACRRWLTSRVLPPDESMVGIIVRRMDAIREELERRASLPIVVEPARPHVKAVGALAAWRDELRRGVGGQRIADPNTWRSSYLQDGTWTDPLRAAAAKEAEGADWDRLGLPQIGDRCREEAATIMAAVSTEAAA